MISCIERGFALKKTKDAGLCLLALVGLLPWFAVMAQVSVNGDVIWLVHAAERVLSGDTMTDRFYDTNPPLSYVMYIPVMWLSRLGIPHWYGVDLYTAFIAGISIFLTSSLLRCAPGLKRETFWLMMAGYIASITFPARFEIGQKDHLLAMALLPFLLAQFALTNQWPVQRWIARSAILFGTLFLLVKPHYVLLPLIVLTHRAMRQRRMLVIFDFDALALIAGCLLYGILIAVRFPDFIQDALPASALLYARNIYRILWPAVGGLAALGTCLLGLSLLIDRKNTMRPLSVFLSAMALLSAIPVLLQLKGFSYHLLPPVTLTLPAALLVISQIFSIPAIFRDRPWVGVMVIFLAGYCLFPPPFAYPTHETYQHSSLALYMKDHAAGSTVFIQTSTTNVIEPLSDYTDIPLATRFPSLWFMPGLILHDDPVISARFRGAITKDLKANKPAFVALYKKPAAEENFLAFMGNDPGFLREWAHYVKKDKIMLDPAEYFVGTSYATRPPIVYDVYKRKP